MSNAIFPTLPGLTWSITKSPTWSTQIQTSVSGREQRAAFYLYPLWNFTLTYEFLRSDSNAELQSLMGFYNLRKGSYDSFLFKDPSDFNVTNQVIGTGDGTTKTFYLLHPIGSWVEPIGYSDNITVVTVNDVAVLTGITNDGVSVTFATAPSAGASIKWGGTFYYRVRFAKDAVDYENFMYQLWSLKKLELVTSR